MASFAPESVENTTPSPERECDSDTTASSAPDVSTVKVRERCVRDALAKHLQGEVEWRTPSGSIDVFTHTDVIEVKHFKQWKSGVGQVLSYGIHHPFHNKRLHLFASKGDKTAWKYFKMATDVCVRQGIHVTFEEVVPGSDDVGKSAVKGSDVFPELWRKRERDALGYSEMNKKVKPTGGTETERKVGGKAKKVDGVGGKAKRVRVKAEVELEMRVDDDEEARVVLGQMRNLVKGVIDEIIPTKPDGMEPTHPKYGRMKTGSLELACKRANGKIRILYEGRLIPKIKARDPELTRKFYGAFPTFEIARGRFGISWPDWWTVYKKPKSVKAKSSGTESGDAEAEGTESDGTESGGTESRGTESGGAEAEGGTESGGTESGGTESGGTESVDTSPG